MLRRNSNVDFVLLHDGRGHQNDVITWSIQLNIILQSNVVHDYLACVLTITHQTAWLHKMSSNVLQNYLLMLTSWNASHFLQCANILFFGKSICLRVNNKISIYNYYDFGTDEQFPLPGHGVIWNYKVFAIGRQHSTAETHRKYNASSHIALHIASSECWLEIIADVWVRGYQLNRVAYEATSLSLIDKGKTILVFGDKPPIDQIETEILRLHRVRFA